MYISERTDANGGGKGKIQVGGGGCSIGVVYGNRECGGRDIAAGGPQRREHHQSLMGGRARQATRWCVRNSWQASRERPLHYLDAALPYKGLHTYRCIY